MSTFNLYRATTGKFMRTITGDTFSRAIEAEVTAGRSLATADLSMLGKNGDPSNLKLAGGNFTSCKLQGANLAFADLRNANFTNADMKRMMLAYAQLYGWTITGADQTEMMKMFSSHSG